MLSLFFRKPQKSGKSRKKYPVSDAFPHCWNPAMYTTLCTLCFSFLPPSNDRIPLPASYPNPTTPLLLDTKVFLDFYPEKWCIGEHLLYIKICPRLRYFLWKIPWNTLFALSQSHVWSERKAPLGRHFQGGLGGGEPHYPSLTTTARSQNRVGAGRLLLSKCSVVFASVFLKPVLVWESLKVCVQDYDVNYFSKASGEDLVGSWIKNAVPFFF